MVLRPGNMAAIDIEGGAEDLSGTLTVDGTRHPGGYADAGEENRGAR
ncbi:hypothetical protein KRR55_03865 [Paeniglutamicibacter sp. ABSL32-1]|nr:hypothetical protein [Paeniglutamicibacter quisquiliarum]MBV1778252.1 hypothetical protein [Paeniglutamicibacter quisquiliarum]